MEHLWLTRLGIYDLMGGAFISLNGLGSNGKFAVSFGNMLKNAGLQGSTPH